MLARSAGTLKNIGLTAIQGTSKMRCLWSVVAALVVAGITSAPAQVQSVNRTASGQPDTDIRVGVYANVRPDCTSGQLPSIRLTSPPENGRVVVRKAKVTATNYKQCLALEVPAFVAVYRSRADFVGVDVLTLEVKFPDGKTVVQRISVTVGSGLPGRGT
jgi:hypothetical protein